MGNQNRQRIAGGAELTATDHLGRTVVSSKDAPRKREGKIVGLFYYLWHGYHGTQGPYDITKMLQEDPDAMHNPDSPVWPDKSHTPMLHWGEPLFGYYLSTDPWVIRRHVEMFIQAGVDVLFFDVTNGFTYRKSYLALFEILREYNNRGFAAPKVCFYTAPAIRGCGTGNLMDLWEQLYEPGLYSDLYFYWKGKPLIICHSMRSLPDEVRNFFTWRSPTWRDPKQPETWAWEGNPQKVATDAEGNPEEIAVNVCRVDYDRSYDKPEQFSGMGSAAFGVPVMGRSFHNGKKDERPHASEYGFLFDEQAETALELDPPVAFLCQWNEWLVPFLTQETNTLYTMPQWIRLQDEYDMEYSRDIEPMKGGYLDSYYLRMVNFIRRFKGMDAPVLDKEKYEGTLSTFSKGEAGILYREMTGDIAPRSWKAYDAIGKYENATVRNEFETLRVATGKDKIYFSASCVNEITPIDGENHMVLFLEIPGSAAPAWEGYSFVINRDCPKDGFVSVEKCRKNGSFEWEKIGKAEYDSEGRDMVFGIPLDYLGLAEKDCFEVHFKWSDNRQSDDVMDFYVNGDAAPRGRMNWIYRFNLGEN